MWTKIYCQLCLSGPMGAYPEMLQYHLQGVHMQLLYTTLGGYSVMGGHGGMPSHPSGVAPHQQSPRQQQQQQPQPIPGTQASRVSTLTLCVCVCLREKEKGWERRLSTVL